MAEKLVHQWVEAADLHTKQMVEEEVLTELCGCEKIRNSLQGSADNSRS